MSESGIVTRIDGKYVEIELIRSEACKHCNACLPSLTDKTMILRAENACQAKVGNRVRIRVQQNGFLTAVIGVAVTYLILHRLTPKLNQKRFSPIAEEILS